MIYAVSSYTASGLLNFRTKFKFEFRTSAFEHSSVAGGQQLFFKNQRKLEPWEPPISRARSELKWRIFTWFLSKTARDVASRLGGVGGIQIYYKCTVFTFWITRALAPCVKPAVVRQCSQEQKGRSSGRRLPRGYLRTRMRAEFLPFWFLPSCSCFSRVFSYLLQPELLVNRVCVFRV